MLGHVVSDRGIEVDKAKVELNSKLPPTTYVCQIRSVLGHAVILCATSLLRTHHLFLMNFVLKLFKLLGMS